MTTTHNQMNVLSGITGIHISVAHSNLTKHWSLAQDHTRNKNHVSASALRLAAADISSAIQEVTADLQQAVLSTTSADTSPPPTGQADRDSDTNS